MMAARERGAEPAGARAGEERPRRGRARALAIGCAALCALAALAAAIVGRRPAPPPPHPPVHDVPLGVEEAVVIRVPGTRLAPRPYRRGASVNVRVAAARASGALWIHDVRYVVNLPGTFDLREYLDAADGRPIDGVMPPFRVRGQTLLTKGIEARIRDVEDVGIDIWHWYEEVLIGLGALWVAWLAGLIWWGRPGRAPAPAAPAPEPPVEERIARSLRELAAGGLAVSERARLEILLLRHWRGRLRLSDARMAAVCRSIRGDATVGRPYEALVGWLHDPAARVGPEEILRLCAPGPERGDAGGEVRS